jgi:hypothetical protein
MDYVGNYGLRGENMDWIGSILNGNGAYGWEKLFFLVGWGNGCKQQKNGLGYPFSHPNINALNGYN